MLRSATGHLRSTALAVAFGALAGCGGTSADVPVGPPALSAAEANARTTVPLTRTVALDKPGIIADLEFDLPPPDPDAGRSLVIGIRIKETTAKAIVALQSTIARGGLPAKVQLQRIDGAERVDVPLVRRDPEGQGVLPLGSEGMTPGVIPSDVYIGMLRSAGLIQQGVLYSELSFGSPGHLAPARYHVRVELLEARPELAGRPQELIIGYNGRSK